MVAGRILLNGSPAKPGDRYEPGDRLIVDGKDLTSRMTAIAAERVLLYHKPSGEALTRDTDTGATAVPQSLPAERGSRWLAVNPMNVADSGLLLLATDGRLVNILKRSSPRISAAYMVRVHVPGREDATPPELAAAVTHNDQEIEFTAVTAEGGEGANLWYRVESPRADRRTAVRALFESQGCKVSRLIQVRYADIELPRDLPRGRHREATSAQVEALYALAGIPLAPAVKKPRAGRRPAPDMRTKARRAKHRGSSLR